jgi:hypothetical protein
LAPGLPRPPREVKRAGMLTTLAPIVAFLVVIVALNWYEFGRID